MAKKLKIKKFVLFSWMFLGCSHLVYADAASYLASYWHCANEPICPHWYVGGNIGVSHLFDRPAPNIGSSVDQNGPGFSVDAGYQFTKIFGAELGFTKYHDSRENSGLFNIAKTEHYSVYLAATAQLPLFCNVSALGKLGAAYSYANKIFNTGPAAASGSVAPYAGAGIAVHMNQTVDFIAQWARAWGNDYTGSADLYSVGFQFGIL